MSGTAPPDRVSATGRIAAPAHEVWLIVCDPARHVEIDGSGMLQAATDAGPLTTVGQTFGMDMDRRPLGDIPGMAEYQVCCTVTRLVPDRLIEWAVRAAGKPPTGHVYGWQIEPAGDAASLVTNYCDWTNISGQLRAKFSWPVVPVDRLETSVANLKRIVGPEGRDAQLMSRSASGMVRLRRPSALSQSAVERRNQRTNRHPGPPPARH